MEEILRYYEAYSRGMDRDIPEEYPRWNMELAVCQRCGRGIGWLLEEGHGEECDRVE